MLFLIEIHSGLKAHIEKDEKVLAADRYGWRNERLDPEAW